MPKEPNLIILRPASARAREQQRTTSGLEILVDGCNLAPLPSCTCGGKP
ncbi:MAG: hypothetical protein ACXV49_09230 [Halobacteriota archaeon]